MKKKINLYLLLTVFLTLAATLFMAVAIFHHMYREQIVDDMQTYAEVISGMISSGEEMNERYTNPQPELRVTVIDKDGTVIYDSQAGQESMSNHSDRPEIREAEESGEGYSVRHSDTLNSDMYYYAVRLKNGDVLRISKEEDSIWSVFYNTIYGIVGIGILMLLICFILSRYITAGIVRPIEKLAKDINGASRIDTYEELTPFITTIQEQHKDIIKGAKMRQEFTANVSHELKTPLTSISGYAELIETGIAGENEVQRFAGEIHRNAQRLLTLINDIIRLSELDGGHADISCSEVDLYDIVRTCVEMLQLSAEKHGIRIACHGEKCMIHANREMMEELLFNLCDNAIRYNRPGGTVDVTVSRQEGHAALSVKDTGIGIPKESQDRVFERFYRVDKSRSKLTGGTGLGMAIVKHVVAQHDAKLELYSEVGKGTEILVTFRD
ncbi:MAG: ATP-binding protein [Lachnospiraceae bacterium]|nr:ATP-binding protein [Lachnospiraceae bacterium]